MARLLVLLACCSTAMGELAIAAEPKPARWHPHVKEAKRYADGLRIIPVKTFQQALRALATLARKA